MDYRQLLEMSAAGRRQSLAASKALIVMGFAALSVTANAALLHVDCGFGPNSCVRDDASSLEWLQPNLTTNLSYNDIISLFGTTYAGFSYGTSAELEDLFQQHPGSLFDSIASTPDFVRAIYDAETLSPPEKDYYRYEIGRSRFINPIGSRSVTFSDVSWGHALRRYVPGGPNATVPEPTSLSLGLMGLTIALLLRRRPEKR